MHFGIIYEICQYLNYFDMLNVTELSLDKNLLRKIFSPEKYINDRLTQMGINAEEFNTSLIRSKSIIAGSFPLQCLLGELWNSDVDIYNNKLTPTYKYNGGAPGYDFKWLEKYFQTRHNKMKVTKVYENGGNEINVKYEHKHRLGTANNTSYKIDTFTGIMQHTSKYNNASIRFLIDLKLNNNHCQFIIHQKVYAKNYTCITVFDLFDFEFCKLKYDGKNVHLIPNMNIIRNKKLLLKQKHIDNIFVNLDTSPQSRKLYDDQVDGRIKKYRDRGFNITIKM
jgi:hypothetical protein